MIFNSEAQASQHFRGVKHAKRLKMVEDLKSPSKTSSDGEVCVYFDTFYSRFVANFIYTQNGLNGPFPKEKQ